MKFEGCKPVTIPRPFSLSLSSRAWTRFCRPFTDILQSPELRKALQVKPIAETVAADRKDIIVSRKRPADQVLNQVILMLLSSLRDSPKLVRFRFDTCPRLPLCAGNQRESPASGWSPSELLKDASSCIQLASRRSTFRLSFHASFMGIYHRFGRLSRCSWIRSYCGRCSSVFLLQRSLKYISIISSGYRIPLQRKRIPS